MTNKRNDVKPSDIFKCFVGTKEGRDYIRRELKQFGKDIAVAAEKHFFGKDEREEDK